jgi:hypothetical protein
MGRWVMIEGRVQANTEVTFAGRIDRIRARVALKLADGIQQTEAALSQMTGDRGDAAAAVTSAYRWYQRSLSRHVAKWVTGVSNDVEAVQTLAIG